MSYVLIKNNTSNNIAFEARVLTLQGQHATVRASLPAGVTTNVALPNGVTPEMLGQAPEVVAEQAKSSPNWTVMGVSATGVGGLSDYETFREVQAAAASATLLLGCAGRNMRLTKLRLCSTGPSAAGETYTITELLVNGVNVLPVAYQLVLPENTAAYTDVYMDLPAAAWAQINEGDFVAVTTVLAGAATLAAMSVEVIGSKA